MSVGDHTYRLEDVHWHAPSEHTVGGVAFPVEQHLKYARTVGATDATEAGSGAEEYAALAVFVHLGEANASLDRLLESARRCEDPWDIRCGPPPPCRSTTGISSSRTTPVRCSRSATGASPVTAVAGGDPPAGTYAGARVSAGPVISGWPPA